MTIDEAIAYLKRWGFDEYITQEQSDEYKTAIQTLEQCALDSRRLDKLQSNPLLAVSIEANPEGTRWLTGSTPYMFATLREAIDAA